MMKKSLMFMACLLATAALQGRSAQALTIYPFTTSELIQHSASIVLGEVLDVSSSLVPGRQVVMTSARVRVKSVDKGMRIEPGSIVHVRTLGGRAGGVEMLAPGMPKYTKGERLYLFVAPDRAGGLQAIGGGLGKLTVLTDEQGEDYVKLAAGTRSKQLAQREGAGLTATERGDLALTELADRWTNEIPLSLLRANVQRIVQEQEAEGGRTPPRPQGF